MTPDQYPHRILIAVSGKSAQILTETVYALIHQQPAFRPTEIHLISTIDGARHARLNLLEGEAWFLRLCRDYNLDTSTFNAARIHTITDAKGRPLADIRTPADNEAAADFITDFIREHAARDDAAVHVSMAGGRKTMGYYAGYALSLYGRDQDRLSHVLVTEGFEGQPGFYYPTPTSSPVKRADDFYLDAAEARVDLANIPFVRMGDELPDKVRKKNRLLDGRQSFSAAIAAAEAARTPHQLKVDLTELRFSINDEPLEDLGTANLALLCWLAWRQANDCGPLRLRDISTHGKRLGQEFGQFCEYLLDCDEARVQAERDAGDPGVRRFPELIKVIDAMSGSGFTDRGDIEYRLSELRKRLTATLGKRLAEQFAPSNLGKRGQAEYSFTEFETRFLVIPPSRDLACVD